MTRHSQRLAVVAAAVLAVGCSSMPQTLDRDFEKSESKLGQLKGDAAKAVPKSAAVVQQEDGIWIGHGAMKISPQEQLPEMFNQRATFDRSVASLAEFTQRMSLRMGLPINVSADALAASWRNLQSEQGGGRVNAQGGQPAQPSGNGPNVLAAPQRTAQASGPVRLTYVDGTLKGLLDAAAARFGVSWRYSDGSVQFYFTETRSFQIKAIPGDASLSASVGNTASDSGSGGSANQNSSTRSNNQATAVSSKLSVFESLEKSVNTMLSTHGKAVSSPATGTISVTDTPDVLKRVAKFIDDENMSLSRQVIINVTVLAVAASDLDDYGINWNLVYTNLSNQYNVRSTYTSQSSATSFSAAILDTALSKFAGSTLMMQALSSQGKVRRETSASVATLNNQPVPVQVAKQTSFLKSSSTSLTANVGSTTTLEPGTVTSGFNMSILPHVLSNGTVMLQFSTDMSSLRNIRTVASGTGPNSTAIETPEVDTRNFLQRVAMKSGETLVISGFEQTDDNVDRKGVGDPRFFGLGGGLRAKSEKEIIVILVTPIAMGGA
jgi:type IVB pilus formation R64 PilN family outer membrane protein